MCAWKVKVHLDWAPPPSGGDAAAVEVVVLKQVVLDAQKINYVSAGVSVCGRVCVWAGSGGGVQL